MPHPLLENNRNNYAEAGKKVPQRILIGQSEQRPACGSRPLTDERVPFWDGSGYTPVVFLRDCKLLIRLKLQAYGKQECGSALDGVG